MNILNHAYKKDQIKAQITLTKKVEEFDNNTCMRAATAFNNLEIIAHPCFDSIVSKVWYHKIVPDTKKIIVSLNLNFSFVKNILILKIYDKVLNSFTLLFFVNNLIYLIYLMF